jgi:microcystin-dependent protein
MAEAFVGEIRLYPYTFIPQNWQLCDGSLLSIRAYPALFSLLGVTYGGDGKTTFGLPDLRDRAVCGAGQGPGLTNYPLGTKVGAATVPLTTNQIPGHNHVLKAGNAPTGGAVAAPSPNVVLSKGFITSGGTTYSTKLYATTNDGVNKLAPSAIAPTGGGAAHQNEQPNLVLQYCISLAGVYPSFP